MPPRKKKAPDPAPLGTIDGRPIVGVGVIVRKTGDGLSESVAVDPTTALDLRVGDEGYIVFSFQCVDVHTPAENRAEPAEGGLKRIPVLDALTATFIDDDVVALAIKRQAEKNERHREMQAGQHRTEDALLIDAHDRGEHADGLVEYCPRCEAEKDAEAAERAADEAAWTAAEGKGK